MVKQSVNRYKKPDWPRPRLPFKDWGRPAWLVLNPVKLAPPGGVLCAVSALSYYLFRQWLGYTMAPQDVLVGVSLVFVGGYAVTGIFVWYLLQVAWRELSELPEAPRRAVSAPSMAEALEAETPEPEEL